MNQMLYSYRNMGLGEVHSYHFPLCNLAIKEKVSELVILSTRLRPAEKTETLKS